ncbi:MAG: hypothetical protein Q3982_00685 [Phoenicibacter congonensis]|uniref:Uncharacterized protein n=1 Tax=Phoenicibacter congonensis TaxID=1944646 RepID=A0AA43U9N5_9ACTN|nr:hypothetical protein [Phoenicibacter congonensis]
MNATAKERKFAVALCALVAALVIGATCLAAHAYADNNQGATVEVKIVATYAKDGTITVPSTTVKNETDYVIVIDKVTIKSDYSFVSDWKTDAQGKTIQPNETLTVNWTANTTVPSSFKGSTEVHVGTIIYTLSYKQVLPDISLDQDTYTYNGRVITPRINGLDGLKEGTDYTVSYENNVNAGTATATVTGIGKYAGTKELAFTIEKANPVVPSADELTTSAYTNQTLADVALPVLDAAQYDGTLAWETPTDTVGDTAGTVKRAALYTPKDAANYNTVELEVSIAVADYYTVVYHGNGGVTADGKDIVYQLCDIAKGDVLNASKFQLEGKTFAFWTLGTAESGNVDSNTTTFMDQHAFENPLSTTKESEVHLYAYWVDESVGDYWMAAAQSASPDATILKTQSQIDALRSNPSASVSEWTTLMQNNARLYTFWQEDAALPYANRYVEFRIIQVGEHDNDGSAVSFMATHALPAAQQMNSEGTSVGGWTGSQLYKTVMPGYVAKGLQGISPKAVAKKSTTSTTTEDWAEITTSDTFWLLSYSEVTGSSLPYIRSEGTQYVWFADSGIKPSSSNPALAGLPKTRNGGTPASAWDLQAWSRSPDVQFGRGFGTIDNAGYPDSTFFASRYYSIVPAFSF